MAAPIEQFNQHDATRRARLERKLLRRMSRASQDFSMIEAGDRVMACVSGGKDSFVMLHLLRRLQRKVPFEFGLVAVNLDQKQPGFPAHILPQWLGDQGYDFRIVERDTYSVVIDKIPEGKTYCSLCSRLRRGILYDTAVELGATKIALGHHRDDIIETLLLNLFYSGQIKAMPPILKSDDGRNTVIRPLAYCAEEDLAELSDLLAFPVLPCGLCGSQDNAHRQKIKRLLGALHEDNPTVKGNLFAALGNVRATHLLDRGLWGRLGLELPTGQDDQLSELEGAQGGCSARASAGALASLDAPSLSKQR